MVNIGKTMAEFPKFSFSLITVSLVISFTSNINVPYDLSHCKPRIFILSVSWPLTKTSRSAELDSILCKLKLASDNYSLNFKCNW